MIFKISATIGRKKFHYITTTALRLNQTALKLEEHNKHILNLLRGQSDIERRLHLLEEQGQAPNETAEEATAQTDLEDHLK